MNNKDFNGFGAEVLHVFEQSKSIYLSERAVQNEFKAYDKLSKEVLNSALKNLIKQEKLIFVSGKYALIERAGLIKGVVHRNERGFGFLTPEIAGGDEAENIARGAKKECSNDLFLPPDMIKGIYNGDRILAKRLPADFGKGDACEPVCVLSRGVRFLTGTCRVGKGYFYVIPDDAAFGDDLQIIGGAKKAGDIKNGCEVYCEIVSYPQNAKPQARILEVLGDSRNYKVREECILISSGAPEKFSQSALKQAQNFGNEPMGYDLNGRTDFTFLNTFTIDGDDSRDFDDAISIVKVGAGDKKETFGENGGYELYVHIADVSHYVESGGALDSDALSRGTSIYLPDRVIPMLPEKLSNGLCSLNEGEKRLAITAKLCYDESGNLVDKSFYKSIIASNRRLTYKKVQALFDGDKQAENELKDLAPDLAAARELKDKLNFKRKQKGFVDFETGETKVYFENDELFVESRERLESEVLIEEFMIAANVAVAEYLYYLDLPCVYRVHEKPSSEKMSALSEILKSMGVKCAWRGEKVYPAQIQDTLNEISDEEKRQIAANASLRAMQKAYYSPRCDGHFGLNEQFYCHFTSPIRRYPDLAVHRVLKDVIDGKTENFALYREFCATAAQISSEAEKKAEKIERAVDDVYICEFMSQFMGDYFEGSISGVNSFGFFVRLENAVEGLVRLDSLPAGDYVYDETRLTLSSKKLKFSLGKKVLVKLIAADISSGKITFKFEALCK